MAVTPSPDHPAPSARSTRRTLLRSIATLGAAGVISGCLGGDPSVSASSSSSTSGGEPSTPPSTPADATPAEAASFDCSALPSSLAPFVPSDVEFSFAFDAPTPPDYTADVGAGTVERVATYYFARDGSGGRMDWDFYIDVVESIDAYAEPYDAYPDATEVFSLDYDGETVPVRHQAITDDQDIWVLLLPDPEGFRFVHVSSSILPGQFGCHERVRAVARRVAESIRPRD